jgi:glutamate N-acetyltransferase/amino-acid N-acetyltransferase
MVRIHVLHALTPKDARLAANAVANSNLVKTALFGADANWGVLITAVGYSGADFDPCRVDIYMKSGAGEMQMAGDGAAIGFDEEKARAILTEDNIDSTVALKTGGSSATAWTCDFSYDYVRINADYRS